MNNETEEVGGHFLRFSVSKKGVIARDYAFRNDQMKEYEEARKKLEEMPGIGARSAQVILAEIGLDMSRFPTAGHLAAWEGLAPGNNESAQRRKHGRTRKGKPTLKTTLIQCAKTAKAKKGFFL